MATAIGTRVRDARAAAGLTRKQLSAKASVSERYLHELENGDANPSIGVLSRVAVALDVDLIDLLTSTPALRTAPAAGQALHPGMAAVLGSMSPAEQAAAVPIIERYLQDRRRSLKGVALLGLRGAGKSTIGALFAARHGLPFLSVTREIEARAGMSLNDLFNLGGSEAYRTLENDVVMDLSHRHDRIVLETAGGIVSNAEALDMVLGSFKSVWLKASPEEHLQRVIHQGDMRPMRGMPKALEHLKSLLARREPQYARADCVLDTTGRSPEACVDELERLAGGVVAPA